MGKSWRAAPEAPLLRKPQYEPTLEEEMAEMEVDRYLVISAWGPKGHGVELEEVVSLNRTLHGAWDVLNTIAEGKGVRLEHSEHSFMTDGDSHTDYYSWYIMTIPEGP